MEGVATITYSGYYIAVTSIQNQLINKQYNLQSSANRVLIKLFPGIQFAEDCQLQLACRLCSPVVQCCLAVDCPGIQLAEDCELQLACRQCSPVVQCCLAVDCPLTQLAEGCTLQLACFVCRWLILLICVYRLLRRLTCNVFPFP